MLTTNMKEYVEGEIPPPGYTELSAASSDEDIDERVQATAQKLFHPAGSCAMGRVVDSECRVMSVEELRVVDASVIPLPVSGHYQVSCYALVERVADMLIHEEDGSGS